MSAKVDFVFFFRSSHFVYVKNKGGGGVGGGGDGGGDGCGGGVFDEKKNNIDFRFTIYCYIKHQFSTKRESNSDLCSFKVLVMASFRGNPLLSVRRRMSA